MPPTDREKILDAAIDLFGAGGHKGVTVRNIAHAARIPASAVQRHFETKQTLWDEVLDRARHHDVGRLTTLRTAPSFKKIQTYHAVADSVGAVLRDSLGDSRGATALWLASLVDSIRTGGDSPAMTGWRAGKLAYWRDFALGLGLDPEWSWRLLEIVTALEFFAFGLKRRQDAYFYSRDFIRYVAGAIAGEARPDRQEAAWFDALRLEDRPYQPFRMQGAPGDTTRSRILDAAADICLQEGVGSLTHRAIAARAGVSLSSMTYHFSSLRELTRLAYQRICERLLAHHSPPEQVPEFATSAGVARAIAETWYGHGSDGMLLAGLLDLNIEASRDAALEPLAFDLEIQLGDLALEYLGRQPSLRVTTLFRAHLHYILSLGVMALHFGRARDPGPRLELVTDRLDALSALFA